MSKGYHYMILAQLRVLIATILHYMREDCCVHNKFCVFNNASFDTRASLFSVIFVNIKSIIYEMKLIKNIENRQIQTT